DNKQLFVACLIVVLISVGHLVLSLPMASVDSSSRGRIRVRMGHILTAGYAILFGHSRCDTRLHRRAFYRQNEIFGYILVLVPVPFVVLGLHLRRRQTI